ncbi:MAG: 4-(cytidine 5'-diphospho)-2-C-methyl-D-erythritol kinase [Hyphomicrobiaceae bacterium]
MSRISPPQSCVELAPAKLNLSLRVLGKRPDGYHELSSLVAFAAVGDKLSLQPNTPLALQTTGPFGHAITESDADNLVIRAAHAASVAHPSLQLGAFRLEKVLPVAAGIGGGSADAAAALRLIRSRNPDSASKIDWMTLAAGLGADVPVCLTGRPAFMQGIGDRITPLHGLPPCWIVLANPRVPLSTRDVFTAMAAGPVQQVEAPASQTAFATRAELLAYLETQPNDLTDAAIRLCPAVGDVLRRLQNLEGAEFSRMSGSGPTCFACFASAQTADAAAAALAGQRPDWWVISTPLLD